jgi:hypothetical protein
MPVLCESCLHNRALLAEQAEEIGLLKQQIVATQDRERMRAMKDRVVAHLKSQGAILSPMNMVHAMYTLGFAPWGGPISCGYEEE